MATPCPTAVTDATSTRTRWSPAFAVAERVRRTQMEIMSPTASTIALTMQRRPDLEFAAVAVPTWTPTRMVSPTATMNVPMILPRSYLENADVAQRTLMAITCPIAWMHARTWPPRPILKVLVAAEESTTTETTMALLIALTCARKIPPSKVLANVDVAYPTATVKLHERRDCVASSSS